MLGAVPNPLTIYRDIQAMPPGSTLVWQAGKIQLARLLALAHGVPSSRLLVLLPWNKFARSWTRQCVSGW